MLERGFAEGSRPVMLSSLKDRACGLREIAGNGADGDSLPFPPADLVVHPADVLGFPGRMVPVTDDDLSILTLALAG